MRIVGWMDEIGNSVYKQKAQLELNVRKTVEQTQRSANKEKRIANTSQYRVKATGMDELNGVVCMYACWYCIDECLFRALMFACGWVILRLVASSLWLSWTSSSVNAQLRFMYMIFRFSIHTVRARLSQYYGHNYSQTKPLSGVCNANTLEPVSFLLHSWLERYSHISMLLFFFYFLHFYPLIIFSISSVCPDKTEKTEHHIQVN